MPARSRDGAARRGRRSSGASAAVPSQRPEARDQDRETGPAVQRIAVVGNRKIETDAVIARLATKVGQPLMATRLRQDVEALFRTGFFYDVQVESASEAGGVALTYRLTEKPAMAEIVFEGNSEVESKELLEATGLKPYELLNLSRIREAVEKLEKLYEDKGFFLARITHRSEEVKAGETVKLVFQVRENDKVRVRQISFLGNDALASSRLKAVMQTKEGGFFSFISGSGAYKQDTFERDIQTLQIFYLNEGYVQAKIDRPQVYVTPDKRGIYISIRVEEGARYKIGAVDFAGDLLFERDELFNTVESDEADWYLHEGIIRDLRALTAKYGDLGYAFTNVIPRMKTDEAAKKVDITYEVDKGSKVFFGRINITGNTRTRDKVIRRELAVREGELYNETRRRESVDNIRRLGFFEEVNFNTSTPTDSTEVLNVDIIVKERNTGTIQVGAGYGTTTGLLFQGQVAQQNFRGLGQRLSLGTEWTANQRRFNFDFTEPYLFDTEWSGGAGLDYSESIPQDGEKFDYKERRMGTSARVGYPIAKYLRTFLRYSLQDILITLGSDGDPDLFPVPTAANPNPRGNGNGLKSSAELALEYDTRNDRWSPTKGFLMSGSMEYAGLGGDKRFTKGLFSARWYQRIVWEFVFRTNLTYGVLKSNNPDEDVPFTELFKVGGQFNLRGYRYGFASKRKFSNKIYQDLIARGFTEQQARRDALRPFGGTQQLIYQAEVEFPLVQEAGFKGVFFYDLGLADDTIRLSELRNNVGFGVRWFSPIGPLRFEWGFPLDRRPELGEQPYEFNFSIGSPF
jgi:outer membrane protein insertion porin family